VADVNLQTEITEIADLPTAETTTTKVLAPDGAGGVEFRAETGGSGVAFDTNDYVGTVPPWCVNTAAGAPVANRMHYVKWLCKANVTVSAAKFRIGTSSGNMACAIYSGDGSTLLGTTGSFATPAAGTRSQNLTGSVDLVAGSHYYLGGGFDNSTARVAGYDPIANSMVTTGQHLYVDVATFPPGASISLGDETSDVVIPAIYFT
jgi:hypothetical protein